jgi:hypothetical protein
MKRFILCAMLFVFVSAILGCGDGQATVTMPETTVPPPPPTTKGSSDVIQLSPPPAPEMPLQKK